MVNKIIVVSGSDADFGKLKGLAVINEGVSAPWICFINNKFLPEQPTYDGQNLCHEFFDAEFIMVSQQEDDRKTVEHCVKYVVAPIIQNRPGENIAIIVHDNEAVASRMKEGSSLYYRFSEKLRNERIENVSMWPFYHEDVDWIYPALDEFLGKVTDYVQHVDDDYQSDFKDIRAVLGNLRKRIEKGPDLEKEATYEDKIFSVKHQMKNDFIVSIPKVESFCLQPDKEKFELIQQLLIDAGALDSAAKLLSDLKAKLEKITTQEIPEIIRLETSIKRIRFLLDKGYDVDGWKPEQLKEFKETIEYLTQKQEKKNDGETFFTH